MTNQLFPYMRGTNRKYGTPENGGFWGENGFNCIEVGYLEFDDKGGIGRIIELTSNADTVEILSILPNVPRGIAFDCIGDGYIRFMTRDKEKAIRWQSEMMPLSSMMLEYGEPMVEYREVQK